jgi:hypothetical protein
MRTATGLTALLFTSLPALAAPPDQALIEGVCETIRSNYVFPDLGEKTAAHIADRAKSGAYDDLNRPDLAAALTRDLRAFTKDLHFSAQPLPEGWTPPEESQPPVAPDPHEMAPFGVHKVERLAGNVGYLDLRGFFPAEVSEETILSAVRLLQGSSALIFDLRANGGGDPATVQLLCSYLFDPAEPVHLNSLYFRPTDETTEFWTQPAFPDLAMPDTPIYVLTSPQTFSGAEEFSYNLQTRKRATIIGETTGGGAHPVDSFPVANAIAVMVPVGRAINPVTNTNWEGVGVKPDIHTPAEQALDVALLQAYSRMIELGDERGRWGMYQVAARSNSFEASEPDLEELAGHYTDRELTFTDGQLQYRRVGSPAWRPLVPVDTDVFMIQGIDDFRLEIERDTAGAVTGIRGVYQAGRIDRSPRAS